MSKPQPISEAGQKPVVAILGRPNVGKSALFNRLTGRRHSIVADTPGVTRDRIYGDCIWGGRTMAVVDTGGMDPEDPDLLRQHVFAQARVALEEAAVLLFVVDGQAGIHPLDLELSDLLRRSQKPTMLLVNKAESPRVEADRFEFYQLGLGEPHPISALHGTFSGDVLDLVLQLLPPRKVGEEVEHELAVALVGRPNVGKSSLLNRLLGEERALVHHEAGTTRDVVDTLFEFEGKRIRLVDTAGLRRRSKVDEDIEYYSSLRSLQALQRSQVGLLVLDSSEPISSQDQRIAGEIQKANLASVIVVNKWDIMLRQGSQKAQDKYVQSVASELDFIAYSPVIYVSAKSGLETNDILASALDVHEQWQRRVDTSTLNLVVREAVALKPPPSYKGQQLKVLYVSQPKTCPPTVVLKVNSPKLVHFSYRRYLENQLRAAFGFVGTPLILRFEV
ncbi:ribosome biogenesis GTPase Der [bacterium]|nr:ribosome biogenesis GTPase Der [bacterium]